MSGLPTILDNFFASLEFVIVNIVNVCSIFKRKFRALWLPVIGWLQNWCGNVLGFFV